MPFLKRRISFSYGWWVLVACALIQFYLGGTFFQGFSALFNPIQDEFGWSYAAISLAYTFRGFESGLMAPVVGVVVDRFGPRRLLLVGVVIAALGFWLFSQIHALWSFYVVFLLMALGMSFASGVVTMTAVASWFDKRRGLAMGILTSGFGASGMIMPAVVQLVDGVGWRQATVFFAIGAAGLGIPMSLIVKDRDRQSTSAKAHGASHDTSNRTQGMTVKQVLATRDFWLLSSAILFGGVAGSAVVLHQMPYLDSVGISREAAGTLIIVLSLANVGGRLLFGWLGDIFEKRWCFAICTVVKAVGVFAFAMSTTTSQFVPSLIALGIGFGGLIPLRPALQVEFFGMRAFATVQGLLMAFITVGGIISPLFAGWMYDINQSYRLAFVVLGVATLAAIPMVMAVRGSVAGASTAEQKVRSS